MEAFDAFKHAVRDAAAITLAEMDVSRVERFQQNTHWPYFARLRREEPVHFCSQSVYGPYWSITRFNDILAVEANHRQFSSVGNVIIGDVPAEFDATRAFATSDPPVHTRERNAASPALSPSRVRALEDFARANIGAVLDGLPLGTDFNWVERVSVELTTQMVAMLFNFPWSERRLLSYWSEVLVTSPQAGAIVSSWEEREVILDEYRASILKMWRDRAAGPARDDIISALAHNRDTADMTADPAHLIGTVTLIAGANEATQGALSGSVVAFNRYPGEWEKLRSDASLVSNAASEILRWQTPIAHMRRTAVEEGQLLGKHIQKGDRVVMWYCSGNRDETHFEEADALKIERPNARRHLAFGSGIHRCLGSHVAEMQLRVLLEEILKRFERIELIAEPKRKASNFSASYDEVRVRIFS